MGSCKYCGMPAGLLRTQHPDCAQRHSVALAKMNEVAVATFASGAAIETLRSQLKQIASAGHAGDAEVANSLLGAFEKTVEQFLDDGELSESEEAHLTGLLKALDLTQESLDKNGAYTRLVRAGALRDVMSGSPTKRLTESGRLPFNFQKKEHLLWVFQNVQYLEDRTRREYVGRSAGVSVRVMKGVYYRTGTFRGHPVDRVERTLIDTGLLAVTNKHVYFAGPAKSLRVRHDAILSHTPFSDGVGIHRDAATAKPQIFITGDGWFTYNLLVNAANVE